MEIIFSSHPAHLQSIFQTYSTKNSAPNYIFSKPLVNRYSNIFFSLSFESIVSSFTSNAIWSKSWNIIAQKKFKKKGHINEMRIQDPALADIGGHFSSGSAILICLSVLCTSCCGLSHCSLSTGGPRSHQVPRRKKCAIMSSESFWPFPFLCLMNELPDWYGCCWEMTAVNQLKENINKCQNKMST